jgi:hypothetical protein
VHLARSIAVRWCRLGCRRVAAAQHGHAAPCAVGTAQQQPKGLTILLQVRHRLCRAISRQSAAACAGVHFLDLFAH